MPRSYISDVPLTPEDAQFNKFADDYNKTYTSQSEYQLRKEIFKRNMRLIQGSQSKVAANKGNLVLGPTRFADQTHIEMQRVLNYPTPIIPANEPLSSEEEQILKDLPDYWDWRDQNAVSPIKDQSDCGASWAYASISAIESSWGLQTSENLDLSVQQLIDCVPSGLPPRGCESSLNLTEVSQYVIEPDQNIQTTVTYPNMDASNDRCYADPQFVGGTLQSYKNISAGSVNNIKIGIFQNGPMLAVVKIGVEFMFYQKGIMDLANTYFTKYHPVLVVGWGHDAGTTGDFWIIKNSFGSDWGEDGYMKLKIETTGTDVLSLQQSTFTFYK